MITVGVSALIGTVGVPAIAVVGATIVVGVAVSNGVYRLKDHYDLN